MGNRVNHGRFPRVVGCFTVALGACLLAAKTVRAEGSPDLIPVRIENHSAYFTDASIEKDIRSNVSDGTLALVSQAHKAIWVLMDHITIANGRNYCIALVGITVPQPKGRNARLPEWSAFQIARSNLLGEVTEDQINGCMGNALVGAIARLSKVTAEDLFLGIDRTTDKGTRKNGPARADVFVSTQGVASSVIFPIIPDEFARAFDYRRLGWAVIARAGTIENQVICFAFAGVSARPPDDRNPRLPGMVTTAAREYSVELSQEATASQKCIETTAQQAVEGALDGSWDDRRLLKNFSVALEDGVPRVANYRRVDPAQAEAVKLARFRQTLRVGSDSHCGLVVELKGPVTKVQSMVGEVWLKTAQLYPKGSQSCRFMNGVYQEP